MPKKKRSSTDSARQRRRSEMESTNTQHDDSETDESTAVRFTGPQLTYLKQLKEMHAKEKSDMKAKHDVDAKKQNKLLTQAQKRITNQEAQLKVFRRGRDRSPDSIRLEAKINMVYRWQEFVSWKKKRRMRQAAAKSQGRVHSTGCGLSTEDAEGDEQWEVFEELKRRGVGPIATVTEVKSDEGHFLDPVKVIQYFVLHEISKASDGGAACSALVVGTKVTKISCFQSSRSIVVRRV
jgi:hypothetical protein